MKTETIARKKIDLAALLRALLLCRPGKLPASCDTQVLMGLYSHMLRSTDNTKFRRWTIHGTSSAFADIGGAYGCVNVAHARHFGADWRRDLHRRLSLALAHDGLIGEWRLAVGWEKAGVLSKVWIQGPFSSRWIDFDLDEIFGFVGRQTLVQFNEFHADAIWVTSVELYPTGSLWHAKMNYGVDGSTWIAKPPGHDPEQDNPLEPTQNPGESLQDFIKRVRWTFENWLMPAHERSCTPMRSNKRDRSCTAVDVGHSVFERDWRDDPGEGRPGR